MSLRYFEVDSYHEYLSPELAHRILAEAIPVPTIEGLALTHAPSGLETKEALQFLTELYLKTKQPLIQVLDQRTLDRKFLDERVTAIYQFNQERGFGVRHPAAKSVIGLEDGHGRKVFGPLSSDFFKADPARKPIAPLPDWLQGPHVTLFGPPDSAKMSINAMNSFHRKMNSEPAIVQELLQQSSCTPFWGADDEDSKTPLHGDLVAAGENLTACFQGTISVEERGKKYSLARDSRGQKEQWAKPLKRFPGLALPSSFAFFQNNPLPLHLYDFAIHVYHNWDNPEALAFYVPKLENEEEAAYIHHMIKVTEEMLKELHPEYVLGTIRLMIVLENPRAILRLHEIIDHLFPYFAGASLGWHDYLASTARLFKNDGNYRIPVKADPEIVIKYIKASHHLLADVVGSRGGVKVGGMYGILPLSDEQNPLNSELSFQVTLRGFIKDVVTQLKRGLNGFWVAHPDFVRLGIALVKAWELHQKGESQSLRTLIRELLPVHFQDEVERFVFGDDILGLDCKDPQFVRSLLVADIKESDFIANNHPEEVRYNVFQSLQYLTDWLSGRGCVALPTTVDGINVRVMDDLATAERSRWEVWHEIFHGRFSVQDFLVIASEELHFIRKNLKKAGKSVQVQWDERTSKWYPVAFRIMIKLMTDERPPEFATELLMPFTLDQIRNSQDPLAVLKQLDPYKLSIKPDIERFLKLFEACGSPIWAGSLMKDPSLDFERAERLVNELSFEEVLKAAWFHGDIGEDKKTLDDNAAKEQALVMLDAEALRFELRELGHQYLEKFQFKFLISAQGLTGQEILAHLKTRLKNTSEQELNHARLALWQIAKKRLASVREESLIQKIEVLRQKHSIHAAQVCLLSPGHLQSLVFGNASKSSHFQIASLSKSIASAVALSYFEKKGVSLETSVNKLFEESGSSYRIEGLSGVDAQAVKISHLLNHSALNLHYVNGIGAEFAMPKIEELLRGSEIHGYQKLVAINSPGKKFQYSGGGFMVLEHLLEVLERKPIQEIVSAQLQEMGLTDICLVPGADPELVPGYFDSGEKVAGGSFKFPLFAAGMTCTAESVAKFLQGLEQAFNHLDGSRGVSHDTAVGMLHGLDQGSRQFMGCLMGLGIFVLEAGPNKFMLHQGANEGFRALFLHCFSGPHRGQGVVILCNADNKGVSFIAEATQVILQDFKPEGILLDQFKNKFDPTQFSQEHIVNMGYQQLLFSAFQPAMAEKILVRGPVDPLSRFNILADARIISVTNQKFARAENLISPFQPIFNPELFGQQGKIMDSWESVRHNPDAIDEVIFQLRKPSVVNYIYISTQFHDGNQAESVQILGLVSNEDGIDISDSIKETSHHEDWQVVVPKIRMDGHSYRKIKLPAKSREFSKIKVQMFPDGGLTRVGLFREFSLLDREDFVSIEESRCIRFNTEIPQTRKPLSLPYIFSEQDRLKEGRRNLASLSEGARLVSATNEHYGPAVQLLSPFQPLNMFDGIESARSRKPGHFEEVIFALSEISVVREIVLDFKYFVNNNPLFVEIEGLNEDGLWLPLVPRTQVKAFAGNRKQFLLTGSATQFKCQNLRLRTIPDGGINRIYVYNQEKVDGS